MKQQLVIAVVAGTILLPACNNATVTTAATDTVAVSGDTIIPSGTLSDKSIVFTNKEFKRQTTLKCETCPEVWVSVPVAEGSTVIAQKINDSVFHAVEQTLGEEGKHFNNYDSLLSNFIAMYEKTATELSSQAIIGWTGTVKGSVITQTSQLINIKLETYTNTGGAHGNSNVVSLLFDPATGNTYSLKEVINDVPALTALAEKKFREVFKIPADQSINATMFTFENDRFELPQNIFFTKEGLILHYNPYEIAPYAVGANEITLPYTAVKQYLSVQF